MKKKLSFLFFFIFCKIALANDQDLVWVQLMQIDKIKNNDLIIEKCFQLKKFKEGKNQTQDSVYAKILHIIGRSFWHKGNREAAFTYINKSILVNSKQSNKSNKKHLAISHYNLGSYFYELENFNSSLFNLNKCVAVLNEVKVREDLKAKAFRLKAAIFFIIGDYQKCIENADNAIILSNDDFEVNIDSNLEKIQALIEMNNLKRSDELLSSIINLSEQNLPNSITLANLYSLWGKLHLKMNLIKSAQKYYLIAYQIHHFNNNSD